MSFEIIVKGKTLVTNATSVRLFACVCEQMTDEFPTPRKALPTNIANMRTHFDRSRHMVIGTSTLSHDLVLVVPIIEPLRRIYMEILCHKVNTDAASHRCDMTFQVIGVIKSFI